MRSWRFSKGHGTLNDFVIITDRHGLLSPSEDDVRLLCDRRAGIGGDGLLRAIKASQIPQWDGDGDLWFMDYRNADGSAVEMCGNGIRVFARYLLEEGLIGGSELPIATRSGLRTVSVITEGLYRVDMGPVSVDTEAVAAELRGQAFRGLAVDVGNPHLVIEVDDPGVLDLSVAPTWSPAERFPAGVNVEFVAPCGDSRLAMRVFERGVGETSSCGTGTVAAVAAVAVRRGWDGAEPLRYEVDVPGGRVVVELADGRATLTGPAEIVARGEVTLPRR